MVHLRDLQWFFCTITHHYSAYLSVNICWERFPCPCRLSIFPSLYLNNCEISSLSSTHTCCTSVSVFMCTLSALTESPVQFITLQGWGRSLFNTPSCVYMLCFLFLSIGFGGELICSHSLSVVNNATMSVHIQRSYRHSDFISSGKQI